ncbi:MAG: hypothetical protein K8S20_06150 [Chloroflexi bacterium]|nr:hypothetical protein [Chloroflexota bacterium]
MNKPPRLMITLMLSALTLSILACGTISAPHATEPSAQLAPATEPGVSAPSGNSSNPGGVIPCSQLLAPNDVKLLLNNIDPANLSENANAGGTICAWQYTPNGGSGTQIFYLEVNFGADAAAAWEMKRSYELSQEPSDIVVNSIEGLADENYVWSSKVTGLYVVFARQGGKTLILRYIPQDVLYMANESGIIDMLDRIFNRF